MEHMESINMIKKSWLAMTNLSRLLEFSFDFFFYFTKTPCNYLANFVELNFPYISVREISREVSLSLFFFFSLNKIQNLYVVETIFSNRVAKIPS